VLNALRRNYPQIYERDQKLLLDPSKIIVSSHDFIKAMKSITPASHRSVAIHARPLLRELQPLLEKTFNSLMSRMKKVFPFGSSLEQLDKEFEIIDPSKATKKGDENAQEIDRMALETELYDLEKRYTTQQVFRPRLLITGHDGNGQSHLGAALLHQLEVRWPLNHSQL
jgi:SpoVK/Ycf46/Vps4 family AAA+-type ATPase